MLQGPPKRDSQCKYDYDGGRFDYGTEGLKVIYSMGLMITLSYQTSFVALNRSIRKMFNLVNPFGANNLLLHCLNPLLEPIWELKSKYYWQVRHHSPFALLEPIANTSRLACKMMAHGAQKNLKRIEQQMFKA